MIIIQVFLITYPATLPSSLFFIWILITCVIPKKFIKKKYLAIIIKKTITDQHWISPIDLNCFLVLHHSL
jgi:hypothetical protein